jgi:hypothetical protein
MGNETDAATQYEQTIEHSHLQIILSLFWGESATVAHQVNEAHSDAAVHVEDKVVLLRCSDALHSESIIKELGAGEVLLHKLFDELDTEIGVVS